MTSGMHDLHDIQLQPLVTKALEEDWGYGDWTTDICIPKDMRAQAQIIAKEPLMVACIEVITAVFSRRGQRTTGRAVCQQWHTGRGGCGVGGA